jgi:hypothetical protein
MNTSEFTKSPYIHNVSDNCLGTGLHCACSLFFGSNITAQNDYIDPNGSDSGETGLETQTSDGEGIPPDELH